METVIHKILDADLVADLLPHADPILMVDKMFSFTETTIETGFTVKESNIFCGSGFLQAPGIIEHMAQSVALHTGYKYALAKEEPPVGYIGAIKKIAIQRLVAIGEEIQTKVHILYDIMGVTMVEVLVTVDGEQIASGEMKTVIAS
ncbi:MAG: hypothetical protein OIF50_03670 [Flavobacteriaceae bacterium]|nr:hypothetical protein [Flavobacteriaceae bacterium]